mgnify:CR=1 FL=1
MRRRWLLNVRPVLGMGLVAMLLVAPLSGPATAQPQESEAFHRVKPGESLWVIAKRHLGRGSLWPRLYQANRHMIGASPSVIRPGMRLDVPRLASARPALTSVAKPRPVPSPPTLPSPMPIASPEPPSGIPPLEPENPRPLPAAPNVEHPLAQVRPDAHPAIASDLGAASRSFDLTYLPVASSLIVPGSGQAMQGRWERGLTHLGLMAVSLMAFKAGSEQGDRPLQALGGLGVVGITLWSPWDAFHGLPKPESPDERR